MISHAEAHELLPWFVNGTLSDAERTQVSSHLDSCLLCRRVVQRERQLLSRLTAEPDIDSAIDAGFRKLMRDIDTRVPGEERDAIVPDRKLVLDSWAYAALMLIAITVAIWLATPRGTDETAATFTTITDGQAARASQIDVVFAAEISAQEREAIARANGAHIVAGPSDAGRYTLELAASDDTEAAIAQTLERLRGDPRIQFAARAFSAPADTRRDPP